MKRIITILLVVFATTTYSQSRIDTVINSTTNYQYDTLGVVSDSTITYDTLITKVWEYPNFPTLVELNGEPKKVFVREEDGLNLHRSFVELVARTNYINVKYMEWYEVEGNDKKLSYTMKEYTESIERVWYWNQQLGFTAILPAINLKLKTGL